MTNLSKIPMTMNSSGAKTITYMCKIVIIHARYYAKHFTWITPHDKLMLKVLLFPLILQVGKLQH